MALRARQRLGKYRILNRIADGPLAVVYRAQDTIQNIKVALKIPKFSKEQQKELMYRFLREARSVAAVSHPI